MTSHKESWLGLMRAMKEEVLLEVLNNYLGGIKTPYNKSELLETLFARLSQPENLKRQMALLNRKDKQLLSGVLSFRSPSAAFLKSFFEKNMSRRETENCIRSLEERLLLFTNPCNQTLVCSPLLSEEIAEELKGFPLYKLQPVQSLETGILPLFNGAFLICFLSILAEEERIKNTDGSFKRRFLQRLAEVFPPSRLPEGESEELGLILKTLEDLKILQGQKEGWSLNMTALTSFSCLDKRSQLLTLWGAIADLHHGVVLLEALKKAIPQGQGVQREDFPRIILLIEKTCQKQSLSLDALQLLHRLELAGLLIPEGECLYIHPMLFSLDTPSSQEGSIFFHATFDVNITGQVPFSLALALALEAEYYDAFSRLKMTSARFALYLKNSGSTRALRQELEKDFALSLSQNVLFSMGEWEKEYNSCRLWDAFVLEANESYRTILEESPALKPHILSIPAPGIFLMRRDSLEDWVSRLKDLGIRNIPHIRQSSLSKEKKTFQPIPAKIPLPFGRVFPFSERPFSLQDSRPPAKQEDYREDLLAKLGRMTEVDGEIRKEMEDRIRRGVIFMEEQLQKDMIRSGLRKVKGLDYQGKLRIIQSVLGNRSWILEISLPQGDFDVKSHRIIPLKLEHQEKEDLLKGLELPETPVCIPVRKISLIRKIRVSLF